MKSQVEKEKDKKKLRTPERRFRDLLRSRHTLILCETGEERRAERAIAGAAAREGYEVRFWDCSTGCTDLEGKKVSLGSSDVPETNPHAVFDKIRAREGSAVWIMRDLHDWFNDPIIVRALKSLARDLQDEMDRTKLSTIVMLSPEAEVPLNLRNSATVVDWPLPTREEIGRILDDVVSTSNVKLNGERDQVIDAAAGLTADDIASAFALSIVQHKRVDPAEVSAAKKAIIDREKLLTWYEPDPRGLDAIGGLGLLKTWLMERQLAFTPEARDYGLPPVKGVFLLGPPGTGKSLTAKAVATAFNVPLLRLDLAALKGGVVGVSEANIRRVLKTAEAIQRCVLWFDEFGRAIAGASGPSGDSGVSSDQVGTLLTWMQETTMPIFIVATSNETIPPELVSRFDEAFFVDLPTTSERIDILSKTLLFYQRNPSQFDLKAVADKTPGFSGRELDKLVKASLFRAFASGPVERLATYARDKGIPPPPSGFHREVATEDMIEIAATTIPVSKSAAETVSELRKWADGRSRRASEAEVEMSSGAGGGFGRLLTVTADAGDEEN